MAGSRLEKIGTIFSRTSGLLRSGAMRPEDKPLWYDVYAAFPPHAEPRFDRPAPNVAVRSLFYEEDRVRARYHRHARLLGSTNLSDARYPTQTQQFLEQYARIRAQGALDEDAVFEAAVDTVRDKLSQDWDQQPRESLGLADSFAEAKTTGTTATGTMAAAGGAPKAEQSNIDIKNIFKD